MKRASRAVGAALGKLRSWWPELLAAAIFIAIGFAGQADDVLFAIFEAIIAAIFWGMGFRHRHLPLAVAIHETHEGMRRMEEKLSAGEAPAPAGKVLPFRRRRAR
jgi:hypothetical protein